MLHYQQPSCEKLADDEINELVTLAGSSNDRPATLTIPSADDLQKARDDTMDFLPWLQEGGDHGKTMWLATCGLEYPDVAVRVMNITPGDSDNFTLDVFRARHPGSHAGGDRSQHAGSHRWASRTSSAS